eukprot:m51a1_g8594 hypothetical protein (315) ;mRNA; f:136314-137512
MGALVGKFALVALLAAVETEDMAIPASAPANFSVGLALPQLALAEPPFFVGSCGVQPMDRAQLEGLLASLPPGEHVLVAFVSARSAQSRAMAAVLPQVAYLFPDLQVVSYDVSGLFATFQLPLFAPRILGLPTLVLLRTPGPTGATPLRWVYHGGPRIVPLRILLSRFMGVGAPFWDGMPPPSPLGDAAVPWDALAGALFLLAVLRFGWLSRTSLLAALDTPAEADPPGPQDGDAPPLQPVAMQPQAPPGQGLFAQMAQMEEMLGDVAFDAGDDDDDSDDSYGDDDDDMVVLDNYAGDVPGDDARGPAVGAPLD